MAQVSSGLEIVAVRASYEANLGGDPIGRSATTFFNRYRDRTGSFAQIVPAFFLGPCLSAFASRVMRFMIARINQQDLAVLARLLAERKVVPVIDRRFELAEVADAMRYLIGEHPRGKVIIALDERERQ